MPFPRVGHKFGSKLFRRQTKKGNLVHSRVHSVPERKQRQTIQGSTTLLGAKTGKKFP